MPEKRVDNMGNTAKIEKSGGMENVQRLETFAAGIRWEMQLACGGEPGVHNRRS